MGYLFNGPERIETSSPNMYIMNFEIFFDFIMNFHPETFDY